MRFTRLRLNGFKSFVDPTDLVIAEGLTGVVGPNGCGKSNLLEAMRWVMGENRPTVMRGEGMEDVIFAGTASRTARAFAEVTLVVDNAERLAPAGFNDADQIDVVRRITRDAGSAFRINGRDVRARDVQMLFADASTGAHSPALVRQGQISELINARPRARRRILEEAAGISGLYQRRHEAELKLNGAEANLARLDDVFEQMRSQLAQLEKQARQAARYREIATALRRAEDALLLRRWREAEAQALAAETELAAHVRATAEAQGRAAMAARARLEAEERLPPLREEAAIAAAILQRIRNERDGLAAEEKRVGERIAEFEAALAQLVRDREREAGLNSDAGASIARLEEERHALAAAGEGHDARIDAALAAARAATLALQEAEAEHDRSAEEVARLAARHQSAQRLAEEARTALQRGEAALGRARGEAETAGSDLAAAAEARSRASAERDAAEAAAEAAEVALSEAETARAQLQSRESAARALRSEAEGEAAALRAEVTALARLLERETSGKDQMLDRLTVEEGFEAALGAALADDLRAPVARRQGESGWHALAPYAAPAPLPDGAEPLSARVRGPEALGRRLSQVGIVTPATGHALHGTLLPGQRLVSIAGDVWRWDGFHAAARDAPTAAALRLQQVNRLASLRRTLEEVSARAEGAAQAHAMLSDALARQTETDRRARQHRREADEALARINRTLSRAEADHGILAGKLETLAHAVSRLEEEKTSAEARRDEAQAQLAMLPDITAVRTEAETRKARVVSMRGALMEARARHDELRREAEARDRRIAAIAAEISGWRTRLENATRRIADLEAREAAARDELAAARDTLPRIAARRDDLGTAIAEAETRNRKAGDALAAAEESLRACESAERAGERAASEAREERARAEARAEGAVQRRDELAASIAEEHETTPGEIAARLGAEADALGSVEALETDVARLRRQREAIGAVNLRAEEDAQAVTSELEALGNEKTDLEEAVRKLRAGIASLNREGRERLLVAFEQVNGNFVTLFRHLFNGGEAKLVLVESDDPLEAGLEIMCQPPGKKLSVLSLLSGGEQTLTALALIFAVFLANPAPICVLDEVDAPLDDSNVIRFCDLLDEMTRRTETRFLIITHHAITMSRMDRLFGVTMGEPGVSQLVSVDLRKAEALVA